MNETIVEITELQKKLTGFTDIPKGNLEIAYVFFQSKDNKKFVITTEKKKIMAAELRIGKYDRIMTIHRGEFQASFQEKVYCEEEGHWFQACLDVTYYIKEPEYIFKNQVYKLKPLLAKGFSYAVSEVRGQYGFRESAKLEDKLNEEIVKNYETLKFLSITYRLHIETDDTAKTIIDRERIHEIKETEADLTAIESKAELTNSYDLEQLRLENEKETARLKLELNKIHVSGLRELIDTYGNSAGDFLSYANGELNGENLSEKLIQRDNESKEQSFRKIMELYEKGIISDSMMEKIIVPLLSDGNKPLLQAKSEVTDEKQAEPGKTTGENSKTHDFSWNTMDEGDGAVE